MTYTLIIIQIFNFLFKKIGGLFLKNRVNPKDSKPDPQCSSSKFRIKSDYPTRCRFLIHVPITNLFILYQTSFHTLLLI